MRVRRTLLTFPPGLPAGTPSGTQQARNTAFRYAVRGRFRPPPSAMCPRARGRWRQNSRAGTYAAPRDTAWRSASLQAADLDTSGVNGERHREAVGFQGEAVGAGGGGGDTRGSQLPPGKGFQRLVDFACP